MIWALLDRDAVPDTDDLVGGQPREPFCWHEHFKDGLSWPMTTQLYAISRNAAFEYTP
jgi:hypothetical protein